MRSFNMILYPPSHLKLLAKKKSVPQGCSQKQKNYENFLKPGWSKSKNLLTNIYLLPEFLRASVYNSCNSAFVISSPFGEEILSVFSENFNLSAT